MAEENISLQATPNPSKLDEDGLRRNSTGKKVSSSSSEKVLPHYLRASTGSCHDFCKYGRKHASEEKARSYIMKRAAAKPKNSQSLSSVDTAASLGKKKSSADKTRSSKAPNLTKSLDSLNSLKRDLIAEKKKTSLVKLEGEPSSKPYAYETLKSIRQKASLSGKLEVSSKKGFTEAKLKNPSGKHATSLKSKSATVKPLSSGESFGALNGNGDMKIGKRTGISRVALKKVQVSPTASMSPKSSQGRVASLNMKHRSVKKVVSPLKSNNKIRNAEPAEHKNDGVEEKTLYVINLENEKNTLELPQSETCPTQEEYVVEMETENMILESDQNETYATEFEMPPHQLLLSPKPSSSPDLLFSSRGEEEDQQESDYTISESEDNPYSENSDVESVESLETLDMNNKMHNRLGLNYAESEDEKAMKLRFRRGKVVEMQPEDNAPRRLKFRRGRVMDNQDADADARRRRYKNREEVDDDGTETSAVKVVLKHQDVQGKKDAQGLFNNVIEETASKLVETRKSKVKALVGAFETVISLQDKKPSANTSQLS
ncbi:hypothetical protein TIFTF001_011385 [Ficus carica]|uniref:Calmodulin-binding domain-containing protein n=1 Tax=Ficus carica TaxID=3494 RepID=A0AA88A0A7_FICCA|nr:hypothetical protein TIFTF001_011385 [Ficus carica]